MPNIDKTTSVLIVDDEPLISLDLSDTLSEAGYCVVGPASTISSALALLDPQRPQLAVIDLKLRDGLCFELVRALRLRNVPFIVHTGYPRDNADAVEFRDAPRLQKPASPAELLDALGRLSVSPVGDEPPAASNETASAQAVTAGTMR